MNVRNQFHSRYAFTSIFAIVVSVFYFATLLTVAFGAPTNLFVQTYVDHTIEIAANGASRISGSSNTIVADIVPANSTLFFETNMLTSKKGDYWTFTYQTDDIVNVSLVKVQLPPGAVVNYINSPANTFIEGADSVLLTFTDMNQPINVTVQYSFKHNNGAATNTQESFFQTKNQMYGAIALGAALFIILFGLSVIIVRRFKKRKAHMQTTISGAHGVATGTHLDVINMQKLNTLKLTLNETQVKIIDALLERNGRATQNAIAHHTQIPKASLSRNVDLLVQKQILVKHSGGYTNQLVFHDSIRNVPKPQ